MAHFLWEKYISYMKSGYFWDENDAKLSHLRLKNVFIKEKGRTMDATSK